MLWHGATILSLESHRYFAVRQWTVGGEGGGYGTTMTLGYAWFDSYDSVGYVLTLHIFPPYSLP
eukprot:COSAG02_NODE_32529_length_515_cov_0.456731_1_plen_64_part_00